MPRKKKRGASDGPQRRAALRPVVAARLDYVVNFSTQYRAAQLRELWAERGQPDSRTEAQLSEMRAELSRREASLGTESEDVLQSLDELGWALLHKVEAERMQGQPTIARAAGHRVSEPPPPEYASEELREAEGLLWRQWDVARRVLGAETEAALGASLSLGALLTAMGKTSAARFANLQEGA